jgi:putative inorganic carbon (HCO3(-)) transporter
MSTEVRGFAVSLTKIEIWPVLLVVVLSMVSLRLLPLATAVAASFWAVRWVAHGALSERTPADLAIGLLVGIALLSVGITAVPAKTIPQALRLMTGILLFYSIVNWTVELQQLKLIVLGILFSGLALSLAAPFSVQWAADKLSVLPQAIYSRFSVLVSDTINPNVLAGNLVILLPLALGLVVFAWGVLNRLERLVATGSLLAMTAALALTLSRSAWMALLVALLVLAALRWRRGWILSVGVAATAAFWMFSLGGIALLSQLFSSSTLETFQGREEVWSRALAMIQDFPLTGIGMGSFGELADAVYPFFSFPANTVPHAHNLFLQLAVDLGLPGLIAWSAVAMLVFGSTWRVFTSGRTLGDPWITGLGAGLLCGQLALLAHGLTDAVTWGMVRPAPLVWALWGVAVAAMKVSDCKI